MFSFYSDGNLIFRCGASVARLCRLCDSHPDIQCDVCGLQESFEESFSCTSNAESLQDISQLLCEVRLSFQK